MMRSIVAPYLEYFFEVINKEANWKFKYFGIRFCMEWVAEKKMKKKTMSFYLSVRLFYNNISYHGFWRRD